MYVDIPDYLFPKLKKTGQHLNIPVSELVVDALISYVQDWEGFETSPQSYCQDKKTDPDTRVSH